jgi:hypothetical protein
MFDPREIEQVRALLDMQESDPRTPGGIFDLVHPLSRAVVALHERVAELEARLDGAEAAEERRRELDRLVPSAQPRSATTSYGLAWCLLAPLRVNTSPYRFRRCPLLPFASAQPTPPMRRDGTWL